MNKLLVYSTQLMQTGGIETHLHEFCQNFSEAKVEIDLVVLNTSINSETISFYKKNCRRIYFCKHGRSYYRFLWLLWIGLVLRFQRYNAFYTNGQGETILWFSKLINNTGPWVHHHHTSGDAKDQSTWGKSYYRILQSANKIIACSTRNAIDMSITLKREIDTIPCFSRQIINLLHEKKTKKIRFGYYGRLIPEKGIDILCKLSDDPEFTNAEVHIWGESQLYTEIFFSKFSNVHYHGPFSSIEELTTVINSIDAFLLLSSHPEGLPISLLEVMSAGIPWLAINRGGIPDIICDQHSTRIIPESSDYKHIKSAVLSLANDIREGKISKTIQINYYKQKFASSALISQWKNILKLK